MLKKTGGEWKPIYVGTEDFAFFRNNKMYKLDDGGFDNFIDDD